MSDYYDPYPLLRLTRPVVLAGQMGCGARRVGRSLTARTGLPFAEVDRSIEHEAGRSLARIAAEQGPAHIERWALSVLERLSTQRPFGLIVLDEAWPAGASLEDVFQKMDLIHLQRSPSFLRERFARQHQSMSGWIIEGELPSTETHAELEALFTRLSSRREPLLGQARIVLDCGAQHEHRMAEILIDSLASIVDAVPV